MDDQRTTYETTWYDVPVTCCSRCHLPQTDGTSKHAGWCDRDAVYELMLEALEAAEEVARLQRPFVAGINRGSTASHEVKEEASNRLGEAQRRWWDLRRRALAAARALTPAARAE